jgi:hypothetical protein
MLTLPAFVWRGGVVSRVLITGGAVGLCLGLLSWLDSGFWVSGVIVLVVVGLLSGILMARRMRAYWPEADGLSGADRVTVVRAARRGQRIDDPRLVQPVCDYRRGVHESVLGSRWRWVLIVALVVAAGAALWDAAYGSWGNAVASAIYLAALVIEVTLWPKWVQRVLANVDRAAASGTQTR